MSFRIRNALFVLSVFFVSSLPSHGLEVQWHPLDFNAAVAKAAAEGKLIYVFVEGDNCPPCDAFKASHLNDPAFIDFVNAVYVPIRAHQSDPDAMAFLTSLRLTHSAVPRFYVISPEGRGISMSVGMVAAPPMEPAEVLKLAVGRELPVDRTRVAEMAGRLRAHAASQREAGRVHADNPLRYLGLAVLEAQAWALSGRLDEAETAFGGSWAEQLVDQEIRAWYVNFWLGWNRNLPGALAAARAFQAASPDDPAGKLLAARALAANGMFSEAVVEGEAVLGFDPENTGLRDEVARWRQGVR